MYYQHLKSPLDTIATAKFKSPQAAHKIFFDTFAEDVSLYLISYIDKHLEMFNDLYSLKGKNTSRYAIIREMENVSELKQLANEYQNVVHSPPFCQIKTIRDNFVHNKSLSYYGMDVKKIREGVYASVNSNGISTKSTYSSICKLLRSYEQLCEQVNAFIRMEVFNKEYSSK